jgi:hypothetical protein
MTQRSLHAVTKVYYRSMSCFAMVSRQTAMLIVLKFPAQSGLISKQVIPYRTCGGTCCPRVSTPKIQSLANSSMTNHIAWWNPTVYTIPTLLKSQHQSSPWSNHISTDGRPSLTKTQGKLNITKDGETSTTLMTAWLGITNQVWTQFPKYEDLVQY